MPEELGEVQFPNWFNMTARENFDTFLVQEQPRDGRHRSLPRALQLGVYTGDATEWLIGHDYEVFDVDTWEGSPGEPGVISELDFRAIERYYDERKTKYAKTQCLKFKTTTQKFLKAHQHLEFDFIYVDAFHTAQAVLEDGVNAWPLLKPGGIMCFDDLTWHSGIDRYQDPESGIKAFAFVYSNQFQVLAENTQYWLRKKL